MIIDRIDVHRLLCWFFKKTHFSRRNRRFKKNIFENSEFWNFGCSKPKYWKLLLIFHVIHMFIIRLYLRNDFLLFQVKICNDVIFLKFFFSIFCLSFLCRFIERARFMHANVRFTWTQPFRLFSQLKRNKLFFLPPST